MTSQARVSAHGEATVAQNADPATVKGFGEEWDRFDQTDLPAEERRALFQRYFGIMPWSMIAPTAEGFDFGCGSGRWAALVAPRVGRLHLIDASAQALEVARRNLTGQENCRFHVATPETIPLADGSMDFAYCLGVLHHIPDPLAGLSRCVAKLKSGAPFLLYLYYAFDNRPAWFRAIWRVTDAARRIISRSPMWVKVSVCTLIAALVYWPLARLARVLEWFKVPVHHIPLSSYRRLSWYTMRTDAFDRFATRLEKRFTRKQMTALMEAAGLERVSFSDSVPYWCAVGFRRANDSTAP